MFHSLFLQFFFFFSSLAAELSKTICLAEVHVAWQQGRARRSGGCRDDGR